MKPASPRLAGVILNGAYRQHNDYQAGLAGAAQADPEPTFVSSPVDRWVYRGAVIPHNANQ